jgi:protein SCO1/2
MRRIWLTLAIALSGVFAVWYGFNSTAEVPEKQSPAVLASATVLNPSKPLADFSLIDTNGKPFTQASLRNQWTLMFFGYSDCPDICPRTLLKISELLTALPGEAQKPDPLNFLFVSLNPENDTPDKLKAFLTRFHPSFKGVTGDQNTIQVLSKACNIYSWHDPNNQADKPKVIDHSATLMLVNPQGRIQALFSPPHHVQTIAEDLKIILKR